MKSSRVTEMLKMYMNCPVCGSDKIGQGNGKLLVNTHFIRGCDCGWEIAVREDFSIIYEKGRESELEKVRTYKSISLKTMTNSLREFEYWLIYIYAAEVVNGFKVDKIGDISQEGTEVTYIKMDPKEKEQYVKMIMADVSSHKLVWGVDVSDKIKEVIENGGGAK